MILFKFDLIFVTVVSLYTFFSSVLSIANFIFINLTIWRDAKYRPRHKKLTTDLGSFALSPPPPQSYLAEIQVPTKYLCFAPFWKVCMCS